MVIQRMHQYAKAQGVPFNDLTALDAFGDTYEVSPEPRRMVAAVRCCGAMAGDNN